ncbi:hypothetical protein [Novosphingobium humi]|uniref:hypothetical protein n=1 Tax=Novosphingobium humi TaxID=2282397 RepID=UPI0025B24C91|nr:hypothetical protein [Novosphingobium humi]WJS99862.1 hypothetical protein NYQ05_06920 [Novosphingobium humi]
MYEKMLFGRKIMYFRHAPPFTNLDDVSARDTQPPFDNAPGYQCSVFYYWWAFLRESEPYRLCCENGGTGPLASLYAYFGDVRPDDFMQWWRFGGHKRDGQNKAYSGRSLFCEPVRPPIKALQAPIDTSALDDKCVLLSVPISNDLARMTAEFQQLMRPIVEERMREYGEPQDKALFVVTSPNPSLKSLHKILTAWQAKQRHTGKQYDLAVSLGITDRIDGERGDPDHERSVYTTLKRLLTKAEVLIKNAERGRFPDHTDYDKKGQSPELPSAFKRVTKTQPAASAPDNDAGSLLI